MDTDLSKRYHNLDFLRAFALLTGVLLHGLSLYLEPIDGSEPRPLAAMLFVWIHSWRMPLFMLLAGFFTCLSLSKRSSGSYTINRVFRLGAPILLLWLFIPAVDETQAQMVKLPELLSWLISGQSFTLRLDHLWFLYYLLIFYLITFVITLLAPKGFTRITKINLSYGLIFGFWLPILILLNPLARPIGGIFAEIPLIFGDLKFGSMLFMLVFFVIGMQLFNSQAFIENIQRTKFFAPSLGVFSFVPVALMAWGIMKDEPFAFSGNLEMWIVNGFSALATVMLVLALIGFATRMITSGGALLSLLVRLSYPVYAFHLVFVYYIGATLILAGYSSIFVIIASCLAGLIGSLLIYYVFIYYTPLDWVFNGYKNSKFKVSSSGLKKITQHF